ncbi:unnamed protein product [marine sediment metagenome]|uniref:Uncharacterized protein n=1 Tax=marine sediment metagenome TaxID=412755 RepID=X1L6I1_9ZZZZ
MDLLAGILAQSQQGNNLEQLNYFYQHWTCLAALTTLLAIVFLFLIYLKKSYKSEKENIEKARLTIKESIASMFLETVTMEAYFLLDLITDHLPKSISQESKENPKLSKFDYFCGSLSKLSKDSSGDVRKKMSGIVKGLLSDTILKEAKKLLKIIKLAPRLESSEYNPTGISYALQGETSLKFGFIAKKLFVNEKWIGRYIFFHKVSLVLLSLAILSYFSFWMSLLVNSNLFYICGHVSISLFGLFTLLAFVMWTFSSKNLNKIDDLRQRCEKQGVTNLYAEWQKKNI